MYKFPFPFFSFLPTSFSLSFLLNVLFLHSVPKTSNDKVKLVRDKKNTCKTYLVIFFFHFQKNFFLFGVQVLHVILSHLFPLKKLEEKKKRYFYFPTFFFGSLSQICSSVFDFQNKNTCFLSFQLNQINGQIAIF